VTKPSDFLLGILDFFAVMMPGAVVTWLAASYLPRALGAYVDVTAANGDGGQALAWVVIIFTSYVLGHFVFMLGATLDRLYDRWRKSNRPKETDLTFQAAHQLYESLNPSLSVGRFTTLKWTKAYVQIRCPAARLEIDRFDANSKFFRSFVVVSVFLALHYAIRDHAWGLVAGAVILALLSFWRYCDQRWKASELSYATAVMLHAMNTESSAAKTDQEQTENAE
jgi:hypothetical protein